MPFVPAHLAAQIVPASTSTRTRRSRRLAYVVAACLATASVGAAAKRATGVCPVRPNAPVTQIEIFDGDPAEQASLAPDDDTTGGKAVYSVKSVYEAGRVLTIRCHYGEATADIRLPSPVSRCKLTGGDSRPMLACR